MGQKPAPESHRAGADAPLVDAEVHVESFRQAREARRLELVEDYVELIADLIGDGGEARQVDIAARLGVAHGERRVDDWMGSLLRGEPRTPRAPWPGLEDVRPAPLDLPEPWPAVPAGPTHPAPDGE